MAVRGRRWRFFLHFLTLTSRPFLSERPSIVSYPHRSHFPLRDVAGVVDLDRAQRFEEISGILCSPKFLLHLAIIIGLTILSLAELLTPIIPPRVGSLQNNNRYQVYQLLHKNL